MGPQGGMIGVASTSTATSLRVYSGRSKYNEWVFVATQATNRISAPTGSQTPTGGMTVPGGAFGGRGGTRGSPAAEAPRQAAAAIPISPRHSDGPAATDRSLPRQARHSGHQSDPAADADR